MNTGTFLVIISLALALSNPSHAQDCTIDTIPPVIQCFSGVAGITLAKDRTSFGVSINELITEISDNCTSEDEILLSLNPTESKKLIGVNCDNVGLHTDTIYATDQSNNQSFCQIRYRVLDGGNNCSPSERFEFIGNFGTRLAPVDQILISIFLIDSAGQRSEVMPLEEFFDGNRVYIDLFNGSNPYPPGYKIEITVFDSSEEYDRGVSTLDLVGIVKHLLGIDKFEDPKQILAADVNADGKISSKDIIEMRKVIIGVEDKFSSNVSGIYYPDRILIPTDSISGQEYDLFYIKLGDVNGTINRFK